MTTKSKTPALFDMKLAVIQYHDNGDNQFLMTGIARDACFTSHNSLVYKRKLIADTICEYDQAVKDDNARAIMRLDKMLMSMDAELEHLIQRHEADLQVLLAVSGEAWTAGKKADKRSITESNKRIDAMRSRIKAEQHTAMAS